MSRLRNSKHPGGTETYSPVASRAAFGYVAFLGCQRRGSRAPVPTFSVGGSGCLGHLQMCKDLKGADGAAPSKSLNFLSFQTAKKFV